MVLYYCMLVAVFVVVAFLYDVCKVYSIHYSVTVDTNPSQLSSGEDILHALVI